MNADPKTTEAVNPEAAETDVAENITTSTPPATPPPSPTFLLTRINEINAMLRQFGQQAIQEKKVEDKHGKIKGPVTYGYKPQFVVDVMNRVLGPQNWKHEILHIEEHGDKSESSVNVSILLDNGEWFTKGTQSGVSQVVAGNVGDARKGAVVNGTQKCLSLYSIGTDAYRGQLKTVFMGGNINKKLIFNDLGSLNTEKTLMERIIACNDELKDLGKFAIQKKDFGNVTYGYKPQFVFDAVNRHIGPENWRYELNSVDKTEVKNPKTNKMVNQIMVCMTLFLRFNGEWFNKGDQYGVAPIIYDNVADAKKGAIVNAIQKCMSPYSIGSDAYRGLLESVYEQIPDQKKKSARKPASNKKPNPQSQAKQSTPPQNSDNKLPQLPGVKFVETKEYTEAKPSGQRSLSPAIIKALEKEGFARHEKVQGDRKFNILVRWKMEKAS